MKQNQHLRLKLVHNKQYQPTDDYLHSFTFIDNNKLMKTQKIIESI